MEKFLAFLKSLPTWPRIAVLLAAALIAYFMASCSYSAKVQRSGVHIDTVRVDYIVRSRNVQTV